jgi:hypothetical protein
MKLRFKISRLTNLDSQIVINRITNELEEKKYRVQNTTNHTVEFDDKHNPWEIMWNFQAAKRFDGGKFEVNFSTGLVTIIFSYYRSLISPIIILIILTIILIKDGEYYAPLFFLAFYIVAISINMITIRTVANELIDKILE